MKGAIKAVKRTPHMLGSKVGMSNKSSDADFNDLNRRFTALEDAGAKLLKDSSIFRDGLDEADLIDGSNGFAQAFATLFSPMGSEYDLERKHPSAVETIKNITAYEGDMQELKTAIAPELELVETRIIAPIKEYMEMIKKIRKAITKRDHKLIDYDRFNNSYTKLRDKKEKSLNDEKNLFKLEQDFEAATQEYEHHNGMLKTDLPQFFQLSTALMTPLFQSFYYIQLQVMYTMLEKFQAFAGSKFDMTGDIEGTYRAKLGDAAEQVDSLAITKRFVSTAKMLQQVRGGAVATSPTSSARSTASPPARAAVAPPPSRPGVGAVAAAAPPAPRVGATAAPPPYSPSNSANAVPTLASTKRAPPPPPPLASKPKPKEFCTALYDYEAQADGDLSFAAGDRIEIIHKTESTNDWWTGKTDDGRQGVFPGNYTQ